MQLQDFLSRLDPPRKWQDASGNWTCRCPAHADSTASLRVSLGRNRRGADIILVKCMAGCDLDRVLDAMGLTRRDLQCEDLPPWEDGGARQTAKRREPAQRPARTQEKAPEKKETPQAHGEKVLEKVYPYCDEQGKVLFEACRFRYADGKKTFRQRHADGQKGYTWSMTGVRLVPYRLPEVLAAIAEKKPVFIVEGEKDADTLTEAGRTATTSPMGAGKWKSEYDRYFEGARVYVIPDNDKPGWAHAREVAVHLDEGAESVRILDLTRVWPEMPEKADVSDLAAHVGQDKLNETLDALIALRPTEYRDMPELYGRVPGYSVKNGCICRDTADGPKRLCNFVALPVATVTVDDGATRVKMLEISGWVDGRALPKAKVEAGDFPGMGWIARQWGIDANIQPGTQVKDNLRYVLSEAGRMVMDRRTEYSHTGWRKMDGEWAYLHGGGAIGCEGVAFSMENALGGYDMSHDDTFTARSGQAMARQMLTVMDEHVALPLMCTAYLAPLYSFLKAARCAPGFALYLYGRTGTRKSTATALALSFFGQFDAKTMPGSFHDTSNSIRKKAFLLKDSLYAVDDYHPTASLQEKRRMEAVAQELARAFGDRSDRGRMNADRTLQAAMPPRCMTVLSGEDKPNIGESGLARFYVCDVQKDSVPATALLTALQSAAASGAFRAAMEGYIRFLLPMADTLPGMLGQTFVRLRGEAMQRLGGGHGRNAETIAHLMIGWQMMLRYEQTLGNLSEEAYATETEKAWEVLVGAGKAQTAESAQEAPEKRYLSAISELLASHGAWVCDLSPGGEGTMSSAPGMIGYADMRYYMLLPDMTYQAVQQMYARQGTSFPLSCRSIHRALKDAGLVLPGENSATRTKRIGARTLRVLYIPRHLIDGGDPPPEQTGFEVVDEKW